jgi:hypothetical protein
MINNIIGKGNIIVSHSSSKPYISPGAQSAGMVRYNSNSQNMEVYDGIAWLQITNNVEVSLTGETEMLLEWAREKMLEERRIDELCKQHPGLAKARDNYELFKRLTDTEFKE